MTSLAAVVNVVGIGVYRAIRTPESAMLPLFCLTAHALHPFVCAISRMVITFTGTKKEEKGLRKKKVLTKVKVAERKLKQQSKGKRNLEIVTYIRMVVQFRVLPPEVLYFLQNPKRIQELDLPLGCDFKNKVSSYETIRKFGKYMKKATAVVLVVI